MDYKIVFYSAQKTSLCERTLKKCLSANQLSHTGSVFATKNEALGRQVIDALDACDVVFMIGGLEFTDRRNAVSIIENAASDCEIELAKKLGGIDGHDGYMLKSGGKLLILLPDDPALIEAITQAELSGYLRYFTEAN